MKKVFVLLLVVVMVFSMTACGPKNVENDKFKIGLITDIGGFGDKGYNDASLEGLKKAETDFGIELIAVESKEVSDYVSNLETLSDGGCNLIITTGAAFSEAVSAVAPDYPKIHYVVLEATIEGFPNVSSTVSKEHEGGFMLGYLAAQISKTNKLGFISAIEGPSFERFEVGYKAGAMTFNPSIEVLTSTIGNFTDVNKGKETASSMYSQGVDYIAPVAGGVNQGVFQAAKEKGLLCFGAATGQFGLAPESIIASQVKLVNNQVYYIASEAVKGNMPKAGLFKSGIKEGLIDVLYNPNPTDAMKAVLTDSVKESVAKVKKNIIDGQIKIPTTYAELKSFTPPIIK